MKKFLCVILAAMVLAALAACGGRDADSAPADAPPADIEIHVNTEGLGQIAAAGQGEELRFDDEDPVTSMYLGLTEPDTYTFGASADEGWEFVNWTKDGEEYSTDAQITVELTESAEFVAVFAPSESE